jgi:ABC-type antimicrobial peptide transport system permease subunit
MFNFILKNALTKKSKIILTALTIILSCTVGILAINVSNQVNDGIIELSGGYDLVIGPAGSDSQLAYNALFFSDNSLGTIEESYYDELKNDRRVNQAIPFAQGDSYRGSKIVGTESIFLENIGAKIEGNKFEKSFEAVVGYNVAKQNNLKIGDLLISSHGLGGITTEHADHPYTVVGIMEKTNTNYDNVVFVDIHSVWNAHSTESLEEQIAHGELSETEIKYQITLGNITQEEVDAILAKVENGEHDEEHEEHSHGGLTSILVKSKSPTDQALLKTEWSKIPGLQAITPTQVLRASMQSIDLSKQIVFALCGIIFAMSVILLFIITLLSAQDLKNDIKLMRLIGVSSSKIYTIFILQTSIISAISLALSFAISKIGLSFINNISTGYGLVINPAKVYSMEYIVLTVMFVITLIPIIGYISKLFRKDITKI